MKVFEKLRSYKLEYKFQNWIYTIALNITRNFLRRKSIIKIFSMDKPKETQKGEQYFEFQDTAKSLEEEIATQEEISL